MHSLKILLELLNHIQAHFFQTSSYKIDFDRPYKLKFSVSLWQKQGAPGDLVRCINLRNPQLDIRHNYSMAPPVKMELDTAKAEAEQ